MTESSSSFRMLSLQYFIGVEVVVLDADDRVHAALAPALTELQLHVTSVATADELHALLGHKFFSVALIDLDTPAPRSGIALVRAVKDVSPSTMVIALATRPAFADAVEAVRAGAIDLIHKAPDALAEVPERVIAAAGRSIGKREIDTVLEDVRGVHDEFLQRFMEAERRAAELADKAAGKDPKRKIVLDELRVLIVDEVDELATSIAAAAPRHFTFVHATSGGEGLDRISSGTFHYAMIAEDMSDLPASTLARTIRNQHAETVVLTFLGPADNGHVDLVETNGTRTLIKPFDDPKLLAERLDDLSEAWQAKARERRFTQAFREKHYDFLRRFVEMKTKIERALHEGPG